MIVAFALPRDAGLPVIRPLLQPEDIQERRSAATLSFSLRCSTTLRASKLKHTSHNVMCQYIYARFTCPLVLKGNRPPIREPFVAFTRRP